MFKFFGYLTLRCDRRSGRGGGVLILVRNKFAFTNLDLLIPFGKALDAVGLSVCSPLGAMAVVCASQLGRRSPEIAISACLRVLLHCYSPLQ